jgi:hypothetical protein
VTARRPRPARQSRPPARQPRPAQAARDAYRPAEGTPLAYCACGAAYLDDPPSRAAHLAVFGHRPQRAHATEG